MSKNKIIDRLFKEGILHTLTIDQKSFNVFQEKLVEFIADREEIEEDLCDERGRPLWNECNANLSCSIYRKFTDLWVVFA